MARYLFTLLLFFIPLIAFSQPRGVHVQRVNGNRLIYVLSMMDTIITRDNDNMTVKLYHIWNELGSAHMPEDDEVSESYMVSIGEDRGSEMPADHLYSLGDFYAPKLLEFKQVSPGRFSIIIRHYNKYWKINKFIITRNNVVLTK